MPSHSNLDRLPDPLPVGDPREAESLLGVRDAWLGPDCVIYPVPSGHHHWAQHHLDGMTVEEALLSGWVRIACYVGVIYLTGEPSRSQVSFLKDEAIELGRPLIHDTNTANGRRWLYDPDEGKWPGQSHGLGEAKTNLEDDRVDTLRGHQRVWISPDCAFYQADRIGHYAWVGKRLRLKLRPRRVKPGLLDLFPGCQDAYKAGWVRVNIEPDLKKIYLLGNAPSNRQVRVLKDEAIELGYTLIWDRSDGPRRFDRDASRTLYDPNGVLGESLSNDDAAEDFMERHFLQARNLLLQLADPSSGKRVQWSKVKAARLKRIWLDFGKTGVVRDEKGMQQVTDSLLDGIARLQACTELMGHSQLNPEEVAEDAGVAWTSKMDRRATTFFTDESGAWTLSDYALSPLQKLYLQLAQAETSEDQLYAADKILNVIHQRSDLAALFVEGGTSTLQEIANQGGYVAPENLAESAAGWVLDPRRFDLPHRRAITAKIATYNGGTIERLMVQYPDGCLRVALGELRLFCSRAKAAGIAGLRVGDELECYRNREGIFIAITIPQDSMRSAGGLAEP